MKGLILSGGKGTRLRPLTHTSAKQLVPVANKPVLFYGIEAMADGRHRRGRHHHRARDRRRDPRGGRRRLAASGCRSSTSSRTSRSDSRTPCSPPSPSSATRPFVMYLGDNLLRDGIVRPGGQRSARAPGRADPAHPGARPRELRRGRANGTAAWRGWWRSPEPKTDLALVGVYMFTPAIFDAARSIEPSWRDELEITDAIQTLVDARPARGPAHRARLVEGHRPGAGHARGQPADPRRPRASASTASWSTRASRDAW